MTHWKEVLTRISPDADARMAELRGRLYSQLGGIGPVKIIAFRGYGTPERLYLRGRVIEEKTYLTGEKNERLWADLLDIYTHAQSACVPHACLVARFQGVEKTITADEFGCFEVHFEPRLPLAEQRLWHPVEFHLIDPIPDAQSRYPIKSAGEVLIPASTAHFGIISSIDNIFASDNPADLLSIARNAFLRSPHSRQPFPGEAALYQALYSGASGADMNPVFYLSSGEANLYNLLVQYINLQSMPNGPILFARRDRLSQLRRLLDMFPELAFLLIGDSEQDDPRIFTRLAAEYPGRIPAIYIRHTRPHPWHGESLQALAERARQAGSLLVLAPDALTIASHAAQAGLLPTRALAAIYKEQQKDASPPEPVETLLTIPAAAAHRIIRFYRQPAQKVAYETKRAAGCERKTVPIRKMVKAPSSAAWKKNK